MSELIEYPMDAPPMTLEEKAAAKRIIVQARAAGHPPANGPGIFVDDPSFNE